jgi:hypothetical protein
MNGAAGYWPLFVAAFAAGIACGVIFEIIRGSRRARRRSE